MQFFTKNAVAFIILATIGSSLSGQIIQKDQANKIINGSKLIRFDEKSKHIKYIQLKEDSYFSNTQESDWLKRALQFNNKYSLKPFRQATDKKGYIHTKYQIYYKNISIEGAQFIVHSINGRIHSANGEYFKSQDISVTPVLNEKDAYTKAINHVNAAKYKWEENMESDRPVGALTILTVDSTFKLAYKFDIYSIEPLSRQYVYVDAQTGDILWTTSRIHFTDTGGTARTMYNGNVTITTDLNNGLYRLRETGRGGGIETYNLNHSTSYSTATDFTDSDNNWTDTIDFNHAANDAHFATEATYDYYYTNFGRNSYDDRGSKLVSYVHYSRNFVNAFWDGSCMTYGDGDGVTFLPLTPIEVVAHEITHGVTEHSAGLIYSGESGALNESFSDIFGIVIDFLKNPATANYLMGDAMSVRKQAFRSMQNPNDYQCPDTYKGRYWDPYQEVHTNSGVQNYWFYLLSEGGSGINDLGHAFAVTGIGREKAAEIAYRNLTEYLTPSSNFADARYYSIQAAIDLFGDCSPEVIAVTNAWHAVGVGDKYDNKVIADFISSHSEACRVPATIYFYNKSFKASSYAWDFDDRTSDTAKNPVHTFLTPGTFTIKLISSGNTLCNNTDTLEKTISITNGSSPAQSTCTPRTISPGEGGIYAFRFNTIDNTSHGSTEDYQDFTCAKSTTVTEGRKYNLHVQVGQSSLENVCIWADLNNNGNLGEPGEKIYEKRNVSKNFTDSVIFPKATEYDIPLRLRVGTDYASNSLPSPCTNSINGQFHDYSVNILENLSAPETDFISLKTKVISGDTIQFKDKSLNLPTAWSWSFPGGTPSSSTLQNPKVSYDSPGVYSVTLTATNSNGSKNLTKTGYIEVTTPAPTGLSAVIEDYNIGKVRLKWFIDNDGNVFEDFEDNEADNFIYSDNIFTIENGSLKAEAPGDNTWKSACYDREFQDFILEYKFQSNIESYFSRGTFIRSDGFMNKTSANGYLININPSGSYSAWKLINGASTNIIPWSSSSAINTLPGAWNVVNIEAVGNKIRIFVNSQFIDEFTDNSFPSGKINLAGYYGSGYNHDNRWDYMNIITDGTLNNVNPVIAHNSILTGKGDITEAPSQSNGNSFVEAKGLTSPQAVNGSNVFRYYKIFRDSALLKTTTNTTYTDTLPKYGIYKYFITSFYDEGESDPTNTVSVNWEELNPGDKCTNAQNLANLTSPYSGSTSGYAADFTTCSMGNSPDRIFYIDVPAGSILSIGQTYNNFDSRHSIRIGGQCPGNNELVCLDDPDEQTYTYSNTTNASVRLFYILAGYGSGYGNFTLAWNLQVPAKPTPLFSSNTTLVTPGSAVQFSDDSRGIPTSWRWYFPGGNPSYSTSKNPTVTYNTVGLFSTKLIVSNSLGVDSIMKPAYIMVSNLDYCKSNLGGDGTCPGDITALSITGTPLNNTSHNNCSVYNGSTYAYFPPYENTTATLKADSTYELSLTTKKTDIISLWIDYNQNSLFEESEWTQVATASSPNLASKVNFKIPTFARSGLTGMRIRTRSSGSSNGAGDACTTFASGFTEDYFITIYQETKKPIANFNAKQNVIVGEEIQFTDLTSGVPTHWKWYFSGANPAISTAQNPLVTYNTPGKHAVKLVVSNSLGTDSVIREEYITVADALEGEECINAQNLSHLVSPYSSSTIGYGSNFDFCGFGSSPDRIFYIDVPPGNTLRIGQTYNNFDSRHSIMSGSSCPGSNSIACVDDPDEQMHTYTNTSVSTQRIYYILGGFGSGYGDFTLEWTLQSPAIPKAEFTANNTEVEMNSYVSFSDQSTGLPTSRIWYFEGGSPSVSTSINPSVYYQTPGKYDVTLVVSNSLGKDSIVKTEYIFVANPPKPVANFSSGNTVIKEGNSIYFYDNSSNAPTSWRWYFAGGTPAISSDRNVIVKYNSPGIHDVKLVASNFGGSDSIVKTGYITVVQSVKPIANFYAQQTNILKGHSVEFVNNSANDPVSFKWLFEGGTPSSSTNNNPYVVYNTPGIYDVKLVVSNLAGADSIVKTDYISVALPPKPVAEFTSNTNLVTPGKSIYFNAAPVTSSASYKWTFSGGTPSTSTYSDANITYNASGTYDVKLVVYNDGGSDSITKTGYITVVNSLPGENCSNAQNLSILPCPYSGSTVGYSSDFTFCSMGSSPDRVFYIDVPHGYTLNIGQTYNDFDSRHTVRIGGTCPGSTELICIDDPDTQPYNYMNSSGVTQRVYYILGGFSYSLGKFTLDWSLTNSNSSPVANFTAENRQVTGEGHVVFNDNSKGSPTSWTWYFPGGTPSKSNYQNNLVYYSTPGKYNVTLVVTNSYGKDSVVKNDYITVTLPPKPIANFGSNSTSTTTGNSIYYNDYSSNNPTSRIWTFEGGTPATSTSYSEAVTYNTPGIYTVKLVVSNAGGSDSVIRSKYITVANQQKPVANFNVNDGNPIVNHAIYFSDNSGNNPSSWRWVFEGGNPSTSPYSSPAVTYSSPGIYTVKLVVSNSGGSDSITKIGYIKVTLPPKPVIKFESNTRNVLVGQSVNFYNYTTNNQTSCNWTFQGGTPATSIYWNPTIYYHTPGTYDVKLVASNAGGSDSLVKTGYIRVILPAKPRAAFSSSATNVVAGSQIRLYDNSTNNPTYRKWTFPGGIPEESADPYPYVRYNTPGTYNVKLVVCNAGGADSITRTNYITVTMPDKPVANFYSEPQQTLPGYSVYFTSSSSNNPTSFRWEFPGGTPSSSTYSNPSVVYNSLGDYDVKLVVANIGGADSIVKTAYINVSRNFYCNYNLGGAAPGDISLVSIKGTSLNVTDHSCFYNNGSVYKRFPGSGNSTASLGKGKTYEISVTTSNEDIISVWIDYNQNGSFESDEWTQVATSSIPNIVSKANITIPFTALTGPTTMRIRSCDKGFYNDPGNACSYLNTGMTEDYTITISDVKDFTAETTNVCVNQYVTLTNRSTVVYNSIEWDFGEGASPRTANTDGPHSIKYSTSGKKTISLTLDGSLVKKDNYINVSNYPLVFNVSAPETYCSASEAFITLDSSETTAYYRLHINDVPTGESIKGTGSSILWSLTGSGKYSIKAHYSDKDICSVDIDSFAIERNTPDTIERNITICKGDEFTLPDGSVIKTGGEYLSKFSNIEGCDSIIKTIIDVTPVPSAPVITLNLNHLASNVVDGNQWYSKENGLISGATLSNYEPLKSGNYYNIVTQNGCKSLSSNIISFIRTNADDLNNTESITIFPNPISDVLNVKSEKEITINKIEIRNVLGELVQLIKPENCKSNLFIVDMSTHVMGYYSVSLYTEKEVFTYRFAKVN